MSFVYLFIFLQSNLLEVPFYFVAFRSRGDFRQILIWVTAINSVTHPIVFFFIMNFKMTYLQNILIAEAFAILAEAVFFAWFLRTAWRRSFLASVIANLVSWQLAPVLTYAWMMVAK